MSTEKKNKNNSLKVSKSKNFIVLQRFLNIPTGAPLTWQASVEACREMDADLAAITDATNQEVVHQMVQGSDFGEAWIGLNDIRNFNEYEWSNGYVVSFVVIHDFYIFMFSMFKKCNNLYR